MENSIGGRADEEILLLGLFPCFARSSAEAAEDYKMPTSDPINRQPGAGRDGACIHLKFIS
jgi:hypothetical protein